MLQSPCEAAGSADYPVRHDKRKCNGEDGPTTCRILPAAAPSTQTDRDGQHWQVRAGWEESGLRDILPRRFNTNEELSRAHLCERGVKRHVHEGLQPGLVRTRVVSSQETANLQRGVSLCPACRLPHATSNPCQSFRNCWRQFFCKERLSGRFGNHGVKLVCLLLMQCCSDVLIGQLDSTTTSAHSKHRAKYLLQVSCV